MGISVVTREYTPRACRNSRIPMRLPPRHEMRPDSPALHAGQLRFPNQTHKEPRFAWLNSKLVIPLTIILERIKYLELHLLKETKNLYSEDFKTLMKEIEDYTNRWKHTSCSCIGGINIVKMTILIKAICRFDAMPIKLPMAFFHRTRTKNFYICRET